MATAAVAAACFAMTAGMTFPVAVMVAVGFLSIMQITGQISFNSLVGIARRTGIDFDAGLFQCHLGAAAEAAADQRANALLVQVVG